MNTGIASRNLQFSYTDYPTPWEKNVSYINLQGKGIHEQDVKKAMYFKAVQQLEVKRKLYNQLSHTLKNLHAAIITVKCLEDPMLEIVRKTS